MVRCFMNSVFTQFIIWLAKCFIDYCVNFKKSVMVHALSRNTIYCMIAVVSKV